MRLLPFERLTLRSDDPPDVVEAKLVSIVATQGLSLRATPEPFRCTIKGRRFKGVRAPGIFLGMGTHPWQPVVVGDIIPSAAGTEIRVWMRLHVAIAVITAVWLGSFLYGAGMALWNGLAEGFGPHIHEGRKVSGTGYDLSLFLAMLLVGYAVVSVAFWTEAKKAKLLLCDLLGCREVGPVDRLARR